MNCKHDLWFFQKKKKGNSFIKMMPNKWILQAKRTKVFFVKLSISYDLNENDTFLILCEWAEDEVPGQNLLLHACINYLKKWNSMSVIWVFKYFFFGVFSSWCYFNPMLRWRRGEERIGEGGQNILKFLLLSPLLPSSPTFSLHFKHTLNEVIIFFNLR